MTLPLPSASCDGGYGQVYADWYAYTNEATCTRRLSILSLGGGVQMQASIWTDCATSAACWSLTTASPGPVTYDVLPGETVLVRIATIDPAVPSIYYEAELAFSFVGDDPDGDGVSACADNCTTFNPDQLDGDGDGIGDACDVCLLGDDALDADLDGVPDACDLCEGSDDALDADLDGVPDGCDTCLGGDAADADGDGIPDACDPGSSAAATADCDGNLFADDYDLALAGGLDLFPWVVRFEDFRGAGDQAYTLNGPIGVVDDALGTLVLNAGDEGVTTTAVFEPLTPAGSLDFEAGFWFRMEDLGGGGGEGFCFAALDGDMHDGSARTLEEVFDWVSHFERFWRTKLETLGEVLDGLAGGES